MNSVLVQILLPAGSHAAQSSLRLNQTQEELRATFGGVTAYVQTPAKGQWVDEAGAIATDRVFLVEVVAPEFDHCWWQTYATRLAERFEQEVIHVRAFPVQMVEQARGA